MVSHVTLPSEEDLATACGVDINDAVLFYPAIGFGAVAIHGQPVSNFAAIRQRSMLQGEVQGAGVFIDPRDIGRPLCFRLLHVDVVTIDLLLHLLGVELPDGVYAMLEGPDVIHDGAALLVPANGTTVAVYAGLASGQALEGSPPDAPIDSGDDEAGSDPESDEVGQDARYVGSQRARSRSPRAPHAASSSNAPPRRACDVCAAIRAVATPVRSLASARKDAVVAVLNPPAGSSCDVSHWPSRPNMGRNVAALCPYMLYTTVGRSPGRRALFRHL